MQNHYNLVYREEEREMMPTLKVREVASITSIGATCRRSRFLSSPSFLLPPPI